MERESDTDALSGSVAFTTVPESVLDGESTLNSVAIRAAAGDASAREELMSRVHTLAIKYASSRLATYSSAAERAADVAQETCIAVLQSLPRYEDRGLPFEAFVYKICSFKVADAQRGIAKSNEDGNEIPDFADSSDTPEVAAVRVDTARRLAKLMEKLSESQREILTLRIGVGLSAEETARWLGMKPGAVRVAQHRALAKLRTLHDESGEGLR